MISIIISSVNERLLTAVKLNIAATIGAIPYEVIAIENSNGAKGICEVYNLGVQQAKYQLLCFMHEDIQIYTEKWGKIVQDIFEENSKLGLIGVAGSQYKSLSPSGWSCYELRVPDIHFFNIIQNYKFSGQEKSIDHLNPSNTKLARVACLDGVWLCCRKEAALAYPFDEKLLKGFHAYDLDFCLGVNQHYEVAVTFDVLIEHFSDGNFDDKWLRENLKMHAKWSHLLPLNLTGIPQHQLMAGEVHAFRSVLKKMFRSGFSLSEMRQVVQRSAQSKIMTVGFLIKLYSLVFKYLFKKRK